MAKAIERISKMPVLVAFNEFCAPSVLEMIEHASRLEVKRVIVIPTMLVRGGAHSEQEIPAQLEKARLRFPQIQIVYAWPVDENELAAFFAHQLRSFAA